MANIRHLVKNVLAGSLPIKLALLRVRVHHLVKELPDDLLERLVILIHPPMSAPTGQWGIKKNPAQTHLSVIRAVETLGEVGRLCIRHAAESADQTARDDALLAAEDADLETRVLRSLEDLVSVEAVERLGRVLARDGAIDEDRPPAGVQVGEAG
jgi:hypothetical protein